MPIASQESVFQRIITNINKNFPSISSSSSPRDDRKTEDRKMQTSIELRITIISILILQLARGSDERTFFIDPLISPISDLNCSTINQSSVPMLRGIQVQPRCPVPRVRIIPGRQAQHPISLPILGK